MFLLAGTSPDDIAKEYSLTDLGLAPLKPMFIERLMKNPAIGGNLEGVQNMVSSKEENMRDTLVMIQKDFGGPEEYMRSYCKMSDEDIEKVRKNLRDGALADLK